MLSKLYCTLALLFLGTWTLSGQTACLDVNISVFEPTCTGTNDGGVLLSVSSGLAPYTYTLIPSGQSGSFPQSVTIDGLPAGAYQAFIEDSDSCTTDLSFVISEPAAIVLEAVATSSGCNGSADGSITVFVTGGTPPYIYEWSNGATGPTIDNLPPGLYTVTVTDANGCTAEISAETNVGNGLTVELIVMDAFCNGETSGSIDLFSSGGISSYAWSNGATTEDIGGLSAGTYCVTVEDVDFCVQVFCAVVNEPAPIIIDFDVTDPVNNQGGSITALVTGGTPGYTFDWNGPSGPLNNSNTIDNLSPGTYELIVTDSNGCQVVGVVTLVSASYEVDVIDVNCFGEMSGSIDLTLLFGTPPYNYTWSGPNGFTSNTEDINNLAAGNYFLTVSDNLGESLTATVVVNQNDPIEFMSSQNGICSGEPITVDVVITGGVSPYSVEWPVDVDPNDILEGSYEITITDAVNCSQTGEVIVTEPEPISIDFTVSDAACSGSADGCISASPSGGNPPYIYIWSNGNTERDICGLIPGTYTLTVTDIFGCFAAGTAAIGSPDLLDVNITGTPIVCDQEGTIDVVVTGGVPPYNYIWEDNPMITTPNRTDLGPGTYVFTATDSNGCSITISYTIESSISLVLSSSNANCDSTGGAAFATVLGGAPNPSYEWSNSETTASITDLAPGGYSVTVTDNDNGCRTHDNVIVPLDSSCFVSISGTVFLETVNQDCMPDANALGVGGILIQLNTGESTFTNAAGEYEFSVVPGNYEVTMNLGNPQYNSLCAGPLPVALPTAPGASTDNDFFVEYAVDQDLKIYVNKGNARPGFVQSIQICVWNFGAAPASGTAVFEHDELQNFLSANPMEDSYDASTRTVTWSFTDLAPGDVAIFRPRVSLPASTPLGTLINLNFSAEPIQGDLTPWNNTIHCPMTVTGSYDPNDKQVSPAGEGDDGIVYATDTLLTYLIRFQNTGTDTAFTVVIKDELEEDLDLETLIPGPASHEYELSVEDERTLVFTFNNIMLPDSFVNEPASNGWVFFDIRPIESAGYGTVIENTAGIFFDFNPPIITNTVRTSFTLPVGTDELVDLDLPLVVRPNPSSGAFTLEYELEESQEVSIRAYDWRGVLVKVLQSASSQGVGAHALSIDEGELPSGVYLLEVRAAKSGRGLQKLIILD